MTKSPDSQKNIASSLDDELPIGPGTSFTFLYYFVTAGVITWLFVARLFGIGLTTPLPAELGLLGGGLAGLLGIFFNRSTTLEIPFTSKKQFRQQLKEVMTGMGYALDTTEGSVDRYQKPNASRFFSGDIFVQQRGESAIFVSRVSNIRTLKRRFEKS
ncbi:hypothetical protein [Leptolyngbya iicbica]|uniref:Uncharacterized protein n=2 Tax=Cyanophyceae TaxID=3028117 RepID=A0A4Q7EA61_9CYAN|nr:hypothetical protein [Leptolyngbya sp. LK]RZM79403.1 hypothetical protein DYY88_11705 [Leptolyngbya sp. LK]